MLCKKDVVFVILIIGLNYLTIMKFYRILNFSYEHPSCQVISSFFHFLFYAVCSATLHEMLANNIMISLFFISDNNIIFS